MSMMREPGLPHISYSLTDVGLAAGVMKFYYICHHPDGGVTQEPIWTYSSEDVEALCAFWSDNSEGGYRWSLRE
jgi:hypothetical protein